MTRQTCSRGLLGVMTALAFLIVHAEAQDQNRSEEDEKRPITITGCVRAGIEPGTFMLMNVREIDPRKGAQSVAVDEFGRDVLYVLNSSEGMEELVGRGVEVIGTVDLSEARRTRMTVTDDQSRRRDQTIEVAGDGTRVTVETDTKPAVAPDAAASPTTETEPNRVMYRLDVKSIRSIPMNPCINRTIIFRRVPPL